MPKSKSSALTLFGEREPTAKKPSKTKNIYFKCRQLIKLPGDIAICVRRWFDIESVISTHSPKGLVACRHCLESCQSKQSTISPFNSWWHPNRPYLTTLLPGLTFLKRNLIQRSYYQNTYQVWRFRWYSCWVNWSLPWNNFGRSKLDHQILSKRTKMVSNDLE